MQKHRHTGPVWGYTTSGAWKYAEYDYVNRAGSFLYEPAGSIHTLTCIEDDTQVWFHMYGVNLNLAADGSIESVADGAGALAAYYALCEAAGLRPPERHRGVTRPTRRGADRREDGARTVRRQA